MHGLTSYYTFLPLSHHMSSFFLAFTSSTVHCFEKQLFATLFPFQAIFSILPLPTVTALARLSIAPCCDSYHPSKVFEANWKSQCHIRRGENLEKARVKHVSMTSLKRAQPTELILDEDTRTSSHSRGKYVMMYETFISALPSYHHTNLLLYSIHANLSFER